MKKKYSTPNLIKAVSLSAAMATLLSSVSPVFAANFAFVGGNNNSTSGPGVSYAHGSHGSVVLSGDDDFCGADNVVGRGGKQQQGISDNQRITAEQQYERFIGEKAFNGRNVYGTTTEKVTWTGNGTLSDPTKGYMGTNTFGSSNAMPEAYGVYSFATGCGSAATGNYSTVFGAGATAKAGGAQAFGVSALASGIASVAVGVGSEASGKSTVAIGGLATASGSNSIALGTKVEAKQNYSIAIGTDAKALGSGSIAIGGRRSDRTEGVDPNRIVTAKAENSIAIGTQAYAETEDSVAIGVNSQVLSKDGVAVGGGSISDRNKGVAGYDPVTGVGTTKTDMAWKSTTGAFSVGEVGGRGNGTLTRQITGVAAGSEDTDAVNVAQLKAMKDLVSGAWKLSANDTNPIDVNPGSTIDFSVKETKVGKDNLKIERNTEANKHKIEFTLSDTLTLTKVTTGQSSMSDDGFIIQNGPMMTIDGINAGDQVITNVAKAEDDSDAVNFKQLKEFTAGIKGGGWKLSVDGNNATNVEAGSTVDLVAGADDNNNKNINIVKSNENKVTFTLNSNLNLTSVTAGNSLINNEGFKFIDGNGPKITVNGIDAGRTNIRNMLDATEDDEAVTYGQLKEFTAGIKGGSWKLSVEGQDATDVKAGSTVDLIAGENEDGSKNIKITKNKDNKVTFALADDINVMTITAGESKMSAAGFGFIDGNGPSITVNGIHAGDKTIKGVAAGEVDTDAVNYKQLKDVKTLVENGWKLSVDGTHATDVKAGSTVDLVAGETRGVNSKNITILKDSDNKVTFALKDQIKLTTVITGNSIMSDDGFKFINGNGPSITANGINAGDKKVIGVAKAEDDTDAVNFAQLKEIKDQIAGNSLVQWDEGEKIITIGAEKDGTELDITNKDGEFRVITGVAAGEYDDDAVNFAQLKEVKQLAEKGWKLSVNGEEATDVKAGSTVNFVAAKQKDDDNNESENTNIKITKGDNNEVKFDLSEYIKVGRVETGDSRMSHAGFMIKDGPNMTKGGIFAANTKITGVQKGTNENDAVNVSQLNEIKDQIEDNSLVKWHEDQKLITIGKEKGGTKIDIAGNEGERTIAGVKNGKISENSTEAINGSQINQISGDIANFFGGNAAFENGVFVGPKYNLSTVSADGNVVQKTFDNVGEALEGLDVNIKNVNKHIQYVDNKFDKFSQDALLWDDGKQAFSARHEKDGRKTDSKITDLLDGDISEESTDAINGSQLYVMGDTIANYFGGGASYENGKWIEPTFIVSRVDANGNIVENKHHNVADAFEGVDNSITDIYNQINNVTENSLVKQENGSGLITIGKATGGTEISIVNKSGMDRTLSGVKDGKLSQTSTEAVNGSQLFKTNENVTTITNDLKKVAQNTSKYFGGSTDVLEGIKPTFLIQGETYHNVTEAFTGVNTSITNIDNKISDVVKNSLVKQENVSAPITIGKDTAGTEINVAGVNKVARKISGVRAAEKGDEAVNKDQLDKSIDKISKDIETVTAAAVLYDKNDDGNVNYGSVTLGGDKNNRPVALHNVKDGSISENSHDAVNGSQINKISADIAKFFGGGAKFINGAFEGLKYTLSAIVDGKVGKANFYDVGSALTGLDKNVQDVNKRLTNVSNEFNQKIEDFSKDALLWDDDEEAFVARHEKDGKKTNSKLKYLLDGEIAKGSTDAITGNQLYSMSNQLANYFGGGAKYENGKWTDPTFKIVQVNANGTTVEKEHHNVADAFGDVNKNMSNINNRIDDVINKVDSDALNWNSDKKAYDANHDGKQSKIINVADGEIKKGSKDAVNGGQLWETNERVASVEKDVKHLNNKVDNIYNTIDDISDVVINIDGKVENINNRVDSIEKDAVRYDRDENGKKTNKITLAGGDPSEPVMIDNVADGKIEKGSKEAVNGGQLHDYTQEQMKIILDQSKQYTDQRVNNIVIDAIDDAVDRAKQYTDMKFDVLNYSIESVKKEARQAAAIGLAVSNLRYNDTPGKLSVGFGTGLWRSQSAFAFGAGYTSENGKYRSNISATTSGGHWGVGAGFNMTLN
ncbi:Vomp family autotransporter [Bartonella grahamii]|uniref:Vomp family autotransporter n=1 Tax=Bartonella grahamii TaxID=33045 RepID=UPI0023626479|nr:Vomp family autotransporter [Bartonella grahamii]